ncbi:MAG TPA: phospholipase D-like domain-containing protein [Solirubrobacterales bacterium]|nr:phospholipase D-like domain-containing protein [Solirubrobacterales bacterium]
MALQRTQGRHKEWVIEVSFVSYALLILAVVGLAVLLWSVEHQRTTEVRVPDIDRFVEALPSIAGATRAEILPGNRVQVLQNGHGFFPPFLADILAARRTIDLETYVWWKGRICARVADALAAAARRGVEVRITLDALGAHKADADLLDRMRKAGCRIERYHPYRWRDLGLLNNRTHRKVAVIDGRVGCIFGHGIAAEWTGDGQGPKHWRDTGLRIVGPAVNELQGTFAENWEEETGEVLVGDQYFPILRPAGPSRVQVVAASPHGGVSEIELLLKMALASAQREILIENPYFIPDDDLVHLLAQAVQRGVDVRIMVPGPVTDSALVKHAGHYYFARLLRAGVKIYLYQRTLSHQKVMIVDGLWSLVGSTNLDDRSIYINDEASAGIIDAAVAKDLKAAFAKDLRDSIEVKYAPWRARPIWHRLLDGASYLANGEL